MGDRGQLGHYGFSEEEIPKSYAGLECASIRLLQRVFTENCLSKNDEHFLDNLHTTLEDIEFLYYRMKEKEKLNETYN